MPAVLRLLAGLTVVGALPAAPAASEWKDAKGATFRGDPVETAGPLALFRTGGFSSRFVPLRALPPADCVRFFEAVRGRAPRADRWSAARGEATAELAGRVRAGGAKTVDFDAVPEPEMIVGIFAGRREGGFSRLLDNLGPFLRRVQRVYPGRVVSVLFPSRQSGLSGGGSASAPWLHLDPSKAGGVRLLSRFTPAEGLVLVLLTREGVPLFGQAVDDIPDLMKFVDGAGDILWELNPANPRAARDRAHYLGAVRPVEFAEGTTGPLLVVDPLRLDALQVRGVTSVSARLEVSAEGRVGAVELAPDPGTPEALRPALTEALRRGAYFLPAIERGGAVAGVHDYRLTVPPRDEQLAADAAWVKGEARTEVPISSWLVLKAIRVPEQVFSTIAGVDADGTVMLSAVSAGAAGKISTASQMNAFNSDWFGPEGAGGVRPQEGQTQEVDGEKLVWKRVKPEHGLVDFLGRARNLDYCVGYAWTEVEVPADTDAWLGIGSDDGLKVWVNGALVNDRWIRRTSRLDDDVVPFRLKAGRNQILVKIQNAMGLWSFTCRLRVRAGQ